MNADPLLTGAVCATVEVTPLKGDELIRVLQDSHQMLLGAGVALLREIDYKVCHGVLAHWARFLQHAPSRSCRAAMDFAGRRNRFLLQRRYATAI